MNDLAPSHTADERSTLPQGDVAPLASQFNNVLHVIRGTSEILENAWEGMPDGHRYFKMLRESVDAASRLAATMVEQAGHLHRNVQTPGAADSPNKASAAAEPTRQGRNELILIVDDDIYVVSIVRRMLIANGYRTLVARTGEECIEAYRNSPETVDLVLLDFHMPGMDGEEIFAALRKLDPDAAVVLNSGFSEPRSLNRMLSKGLLGFIPKPHSQRELLTQIRVTLDALASSRNTFPAASETST